MACTEVEDIIDKFNTFTKKPVKFLSVQEDVKDDIKKLVKSLYDYTKSQEKSGKREKKSALPELIVNDFDEEQIWQEIELQNSECWDDFVWEVANCMSNKDALKFPVEIVDDNKNASQDEEEPSDEENLPSEEDIDSNNKISSKKNAKPKKKVKPSIVDDKFFKLNEMEQFLLKEERKGDKGEEASDEDEESIDYFEDIDEDDSEEEGGKDVMYKDFFDEDNDEQEETQENASEQSENESEHSENENESEQNEYDEVPKSQSKSKDKRVTFDLMPDNDSNSEEGDDSDTENLNQKNKTKDTNAKTNETEKKSDFELRQQRLQQTISRLEEKNLKEAPWQLKGEVDANKRPQNSLLQEVVDFDLTTRPAPIITEQTTVTLEDIIKRRIKDKAWDDVERKEKPVDDQLSFRKEVILDHSKSKLSLAQVYEAEYLKQKQASSGEVEEKEPEAHTEIRDTMKKLFAKLDALCNYHYTPKAPQAEVKIVTNTPAISMEEVAPVATSDAALLAPEEIKKKQRGDLMSKEERTKTDKNRERRKKKKMQKQKGHIMKVTDNRNTKKGIQSDDKALKTSKAFFQQLNDDSTSLIKKNKSKIIVKNSKMVKK